MSTHRLPKRPPAWASFHDAQTWVPGPSLRSRPWSLGALAAFRRESQCPRPEHPEATRRAGVWQLFQLDQWGRKAEPSSRVCEGTARAETPGSFLLIICFFVF